MAYMGGEIIICINSVSYAKYHWNNTPRLFMENLYTLVYGMAVMTGTGVRHCVSSLEYYI